MVKMRWPITNPLKMNNKQAISINRNNLNHRMERLNVESVGNSFRTNQIYDSINGTLIRLSTCTTANCVTNDLHIKSNWLHIVERKSTFVYIHTSVGCVTAREYYQNSIANVFNLNSNQFLYADSIRDNPSKHTWERTWWISIWMARNALFNAAYAVECMSYAFKSIKAIQYFH